MRTGAQYALLLLLSVELALAEAVLSGTRPFGHPWPAAALLAAAANPVLGYAGGRLLGRLAGAAVPGLLWLVITLVLGSSRPEGDLVITGSGRGFALIVVGALAAVIGPALWATPRGPTGR